MAMFPPRQAGPPSAATLRCTKAPSARDGKGCPMSQLAAAEQAVALLIDDLLRLGDREGDRIVLAAVGVDPDEAMLLYAIVEGLDDQARRVPARGLALRRGRDPIALVLDRFGRHRGRFARSEQVAQRIHQAHDRPRYSLARRRLDPRGARCLRRGPCRPLSLT